MGVNIGGGMCTFQGRGVMRTWSRVGFGVHEYWAVGVTTCTRTPLASALISFCLEPYRLGLGGGELETPFPPVETEDSQPCRT